MKTTSLEKILEEGKRAERQRLYEEYHKAAITGICSNPHITIGGGPEEWAKLVVETAATVTSLALEDYYKVLTEKDPKEEKE